MTTSRPILMSGPMVRAILAGRKTQTRRIVKGTTERPSAKYSDEYMEAWKNDAGWAQICPYGKPGDNLWVRETWGRANGFGGASGDVLVYRADVDLTGVRWKPSIHMPRWASRINLQVLSVRVERLQDISEEDAIAEGVEYHHDEKEAFAGWYSADRTVLYPTAKRAFQDLFESINGPEAWERNDWLWVISFPKFTPQT